MDSYSLITVGTGFASSFFLKRYLAKAPASAKVLVLERWYPYPHSERLKSLRGEDSAYAGRNPEPEDTFINNNPEKEWNFSTGFGGSSNCWYGCTPRFMPSDFKLKSLYGVAQDWPLDYESLEPYYEEAEQIMAISGPPRTPFPKRTAYPLPPHTFSPIDTRLQKEYGDLYVSQPTARASRPVNGRSSCCASAICSVCPVNAKFTIENGNLGVYDDPRVEVLYGAAVTRLDLQNDAVRGVYFSKDGREQRASGEVVVLGANGLFNANILLNSGDGNPFTGKGLGEQVALNAVVYLDNLRNVGGSTFVNANGYMLYDGAHRKDHAACLMEANNAPYIRPDRGKWRDVVIFRMIFEDLPQEDNAVIATADPLVPEVNFSGHSDYALRGIAHMKEALPGLLACLPVERILFRGTTPTESHILGAARMSNSPAEGVVDRHLRHHRYRNLFVLGGSAFPSYSPSNPTLTISAMSLWAADQSF